MKIGINVIKQYQFITNSAFKFAGFTLLIKLSYEQIIYIYFYIWLKVPI